KDYSKARGFYHLPRLADNTVPLIRIPLRIDDRQLREDLDELPSVGVGTLVSLSQKLDLPVGLIRRNGEALVGLAGVVGPLAEPAVGVEGQADIAVVDGGDGVEQRQDEVARRPPLLVEGAAKVDLDQPPDRLPRLRREVVELDP